MLAYQEYLELKSLIAEKDKANLTEEQRQAQEDAAEGIAEAKAVFEADQTPNKLEFIEWLIDHFAPLKQDGTKVTLPANKTGKPLASWLFAKVT